MRNTAESKFTLIELLVVIAIITILAALLLPALNKARDKGKETRELNATKQLMIAYHSYSDANDGYLLPGFPDWADNSLRDDRGNAMVMGIVSMRWPWRLYPYLKNLHGTILTGAMSDYMKSAAFAPGAPTAGMYNYYISVFPSFALNRYNVGGQYPNPKSSAANDPDVAVKTSDLKQPSRLIVFVSSFSAHPYGYEYCMDPVKAGWQTLTAPFDPDSSSYGYVHARWSGRAVTAEADGHAEMVQFDKLRTEINRWKNIKD